MSNIQTGAERMPHDLSHHGFLAGQIGGILYSRPACMQAWRNHGHSCFLCEIVIRSQFHTTYEPEA